MRKVASGKKEVRGNCAASEYEERATRSPRSPRSPQSPGKPWKNNAKPNKSPVGGVKSASPKSGVAQIVIHVLDEQRGVSKDFYCPRKVLLREMQYFKTYLGDKHQVDISVHCDIHVFEWLMSYARNHQNAQELDVRSAVSILIASDFLGMDTLLAKVVKFVSSHLDEILSLPIDLNCIHDSLLDRLCEFVEPRHLYELKDPQNKLLSRLFRAKTKELLRSSRGILAQCRKCSHIYSLEWGHSLLCSATEPIVDYRGVLRQLHVPVKDWNPVKHFCEPLRRNASLPWSPIYWTLWSSTRVFRCSAREMIFNG
eukprot:CAMPEP_0184560576 /NCGR_PEP_ID=MMETSP0199_2-20130426/47005_1 /TAXON_ID=1112570 /ORGANISM="Thraustochytrium sp., Strain LLF1b" /LENGTH=311 /DNA_ID=CAMNT_0026957881 /DNA_START=205 /DNA_END=1136 /DNA_ORIENTATION=+